MTQEYYHDIKEGDILKLGKLELRVLMLVDNGNLLVRYRHCSFFIRTGTYERRNGFGIYNYGRRNGDRVHLRIEVPEGQDYKIIKEHKHHEPVQE